MEKYSKIYITGHTGMLGSTMIRKLVDSGYKNLVFRTHNELDLTRQSDVEDFFQAERPEYVFHIAAKTAGVMLNKKYPVEFLGDGTLIAVNVLQAAYQFEVKGLVFVSSANIYPEDAPQPMTEEQFMNGRMPYYWSGYALAKTVGVKFCESAHVEAGKHFISAVLPAVYGPHDFGSTVLPMLLDKFANAVTKGEQVVEIWGTGEARRDFIHSEDVADALIFLMEHGKGGQHYNVGSGKERTIREVAEFLQEVSGFTGKLSFDLTKPESANRQFLDASKINSLGWAPKIMFEEGAKRAYQEHLERIRKV